jgi:hypothetical protein
LNSNFSRMNKEIFSSLPPQKRCDLLWNEGQFLVSVGYYRFKASLYSLRSFFVEVLCYQDSTAIERIEVASEERLAKYLNQIDVNVLPGLKSPSTD